MLQTDLGVGKLTDKLLNWPSLDWPGLLTELKNRKLARRCRSRWSGNHFLTSNAPKP